MHIVVKSWESCKNLNMFQLLQIGSKTCVLQGFNLQNARNFCS